MYMPKIQQTRIWPSIVGALIFVVLLALIVTVFNLPVFSTVSRDAGHRLGSAIKPEQLVPNETDQGVENQNIAIGIPESPQSSNRWCDGDETLCTTITTTRPVETLQKLIAAIPQGNAKQYKIRLSVTPIEEPGTDDAAK